MKTAETSLGTPEHIAIAIAYALGWLSGLVLLLVEKNNDKVRYHAAQSIVLFGGITLLNLVISIVPLWRISFLLLNALSLVAIVAWIVFIVTSLNKKPITVELVKGYVEQLQRAIKT